MHKDLGLQLYTVRDEIAKTTSLDSIFAQVAAAGYKQIELYGYKPDRTFFDRGGAEYVYFSRPSFLSSCCACFTILSLITRSKVKFFSTTPARISSSSMI